MMVYPGYVSWRNKRENINRPSKIVRGTRRGFLCAYAASYVIAYILCTYWLPMSENNITQCPPLLA